MPLPVGLVYDPAGKVVLDPDTGVQQAIRHLFTLFARTGSARATVQQFNADGLLFPVRVRTGARKGELAWMPLQHWRVLRILHNPRYAGAFAYGRRRERLAANGKKTFDTAAPRAVDRADPRRPPRLHQLGPVRDQPAAAAGQRHRARRRPRRRPRPRRHRPAAGPGHLRALRTADDGALPHPPRHRGPRLPMHEPLHPRRRATLPSHPRRHRRRRRRPRCCSTPSPRSRSRSPSPCRPNSTPAPPKPTRCAASTSNAPATAPTWPAAATWPSTPTTGSSPTASKPTGTTRCAPCRPPSEDYERASAAAAATLTDELKDRIRSLATDFPALWSNPHTPQRDRKRMVRLLVDDVTLHKTDRIHLHVRFRGGQTTSLAVAIPPTAWQARQTHPDTLAALDRLLDTHTDAETADALNAAGHRSGEGKPFTAGIVVARPPQVPSTQPRRPAPRPRPAHHNRTRATPRRAPQHHQELDQRRNPQLPQGKRQERTALPTTHPRRSHASPPDKAAR